MKDKNAADQKAKNEELVSNLKKQHLDEIDEKVQKHKLEADDLFSRLKARDQQIEDLNKKHEDLTSVQEKKH